MTKTTRRPRRAREVSPPTPGPASMTATQPTPEPSLSINIEDFEPVIAAAILKAQDAIGKIAKTNTNEYAGYAYASIDQFYEQAAPLMRKNGLSVMAHCHGYTPLGTDYIIFDFHGSIMHKSGKRHQLGMVPIPMPIQGPQTAGAAMSYAEKILMRALFKIATGEPDADATAKDGPGNVGRSEKSKVHYIHEKRGGDRPTQARRQEPDPKPENNAPKMDVEPIDIYDLPRHVGKAKSYEELQTLWRTQNLSRLEASDPINYRWLSGVFEQRSAQFTQKAHG